MYSHFGLRFMFSLFLFPHIFIKRLSPKSQIVICFVRKKQELQVVNVKIQICKPLNYLLSNRSICLAAIARQNHVLCGWQTWPRLQYERCCLTHSVVWNMTEVPVIGPSGISNDKGLQLLSGVTIIYLDIRSRPTITPFQTIIN